jgi:hypothetical protein
MALIEANMGSEESNNENHMLSSMKLRVELIKGQILNKIKIKKVEV